MQIVYWEESLFFLFVFFLEIVYLFTGKREIYFKISSVNGFTKRDKQ